MILFLIQARVLVEEQIYLEPQRSQTNHLLLGIPVGLNLTSNTSYLIASLSGRSPQPQSSRQPVDTLAPTPSDPLDPAEDLFDPVLLNTVLEFGYDDYITRLAIKRTKGVSAEAAINWILDHSNQSDYEGSEESSEEDVEMGGIIL